MALDLETEMKLKSDQVRSLTALSQSQEESIHQLEADNRELTERVKLLEAALALWVHAFEKAFSEDGDCNTDYFDGSLYDKARTVLAGSTDAPGAPKKE